MIGLANWWHQFHEIWSVIKGLLIFIFNTLVQVSNPLLFFFFIFRKVQFCCCCFPVSKLCPILCDSIDCSMPGSYVPAISRSLLKFRYNLHGVKCINSAGQWVGQMHTPMSSTPLSRCRSFHLPHRVLSCPLPVSPHSFLSDFYHCSLVLPVLELHINGVMLCVLFCIRLL